MKKILFVIWILAMFAISCEFDGSSNVSNKDSLDVVCDTTISVIDSVSTDTLVQCKGITKKGTQCERMVLESDGYCFQHIGQKQ